MLLSSEYIEVYMLFQTPFVVTATALPLLISTLLLLWWFPAWGCPSLTPTCPCRQRLGLKNHGSDATLSRLKHNIFYLVGQAPVIQK